jgi:creatinine amidohydrolase
MEIRFAKMKWPEINQAVSEKRIVVIPAGTLEDHGLHLPVDTDVVVAEEICKRLVLAIPDKTILFPPITFGYSPHHIDGPGVITIRWDTFIESTTQILSSLAYHGFRKILIVNGHGSNQPVLDIATRQANVQNPDIQCAFTSWWQLKEVQDAVAEFRESKWTGHACELETSAYLAIDPASVDMSLCREDFNPYLSPHFWSDLVGQVPEGTNYANPISLKEYWSSLCETGTMGDPSAATAEKGEIMITAAVHELRTVIEEFGARPIRERKMHQNPDVQARNQKIFGAVPKFTN